MAKNPLYTSVIQDTNQGGYYFPVVAANASVAAKAATADLSSSDMGKNVTNTGAAGTIVLTLPKVADVSERFFRVQVTAAQIVRLDPNGTESVYLGGSGVAGKYLQVAGTIGNYADLYCDGTRWHVTGYAGVVTKEA